VEEGRWSQTGSCQGAKSYLPWPRLTKSKRTSWSQIPN